MAMMLTENLDCLVNTFNRPLEALTALADINPAVVITDYYMPELDGLTFINRAAPLIPAAAFVLITGHNLGEPTDHFARVKPLKAFLPKPFSWRTLADEIMRVWPAQVPAVSYRR
jgi:CheY-like chemotaxis protein